jgi:hypothetical protein
MYHPYFRGKQYELITIREMAGLMALARRRPRWCHHCKLREHATIHPLQ